VWVTLTGSLVPAAPIDQEVSAAFDPIQRTRQIIANQAATGTPYTEDQIKHVHAQSIAEFSRRRDAAARVDEVVNDTLGKRLTRSISRTASGLLGPEPSGEKDFFESIGEGLTGAISPTNTLIKLYRDSQRKIQNAWRTIGE